MSSRLATYTASEVAEPPHLEVAEPLPPSPSPRLHDHGTQAPGLQDAKMLCARAAQSGGFSRMILSAQRKQPR